MNDKKKPAYNMWQSTGFLLREAWKIRKSAIFFCILMAAVTSGVSVVELLIAPMILKKIEVAAPFGELLGTIGLFSVSLLLLTGLKGYLQQNLPFMRMEIRKNLYLQVGDKAGRTAFPNTLDTEFYKYSDLAADACYGEKTSADEIWNVLTAILTNIIGFSIYMVLLSNLHPWLLLVVVVTAGLGFFLNMFFDKKVHILQKIKTAPSVYRTSKIGQ